jgi:hypothetical protein
MLTICNNFLYSQNRKLVSNVYYSNVKLSGSEIWLNSDSSYFLSYAGCIDNDITKGNWTLRNDTFVLSTSNHFEIKARIELTKTKNLDREIQVLDYYGLPIPNLNLTFMGDTDRIYQTTTDSNGLIVLKSANYNLVYFDNLENRYFESTNPNKDLVYNIEVPNRKERIVYKFNYPKELIKESSRVKNFYNEEETLLLWSKKNKLIEIKYNREYKKKY